MKSEAQDPLYTRPVDMSRDPLDSLLRALQPSYERDVPRGAWQGFARRFLRSGETVIAAMMGERFTWGESLILVTDQRAVQLRRGVVAPWKVIREVPPAAVTGARVEKGLITERVIVETAGAANALRVRSRIGHEAVGRAFAEQVDRLVRKR